MANDNNNINELVADDDDPTVELKSLAFAKGPDSELEADDQTFDSKNDSEEVSLAGVTVSELKSDLRSRQKTIGKLQYDIEQLHAKWLGLDTETAAREAQTDQLTTELESARDAVARKEKLINKRDGKIKSLKSKIRSRNEDFHRFKIRFDELEHIADENVSPQVDTDTAAPHVESDAGALLRKFSRSERYADELRQKSQDLIKANDSYEREVPALTQQLREAKRSNSEFVCELAAAKASIDDLQDQLASVESKHASEIRTLRFELGHAQDTVVESEEVNSQLASDLVDARDFKEELERMLGDVEETSADRIEQLEKELRKLKRAAESYNQKLTTKSEAISVLLAELAKKSEPIESIGKIEDVIHDIDECMSERSVKNPPVDRATRMLIGTVDDQVLRFPLFKDRVTIGRTNDNDIQLMAAYVSRRHAVIQTDGDSTRIIDWGSKNGIQINSTKVKEHFLNHGDTITIGNARFRYEELKKRDI